MTDKEFKKLKRADLIEIIYQLQENETQLKRENEELLAQLEDRRIKIQKAGTIAEAAIAMNELFETAQKTAADYLGEVMIRRNEARQLLAKAQKEYDRIIEEANSKAQEIIKKAEKR